MCGVGANLLLAALERVDRAEARVAEREEEQPHPRDRRRRDQEERRGEEHAALGGHLGELRAHPPGEHAGEHERERGDERLR